MCNNLQLKIVPANVCCSSNRTGLSHKLLFLLELKRCICSDRKSSRGGLTRRWFFSLSVEFVNKTQLLLRLLHLFSQTIWSSSAVLLQVNAIFEIFPLYHKAAAALLFFSQFSRAQFTQIQSGTNQKNLKLNFMGAGIYLSICSMFWCEITQSLSLAAVQLFCPLNSWFIAA